MRNRILKDYTGHGYNKLTALRFHSLETGKPPKWVWLCNCGTEVVISAKDVVSGHTKSCGCLAKEILVKRNTKHGLCNMERETYKSWKDMRSRCYSEKNKEYKNYGARGIKVCERWLKFENFYADMGRRPDGLTIDRKNNNGNYEPSNCRWADSEQQANNKRNNVKLNINNEIIGITQLSRKIKKSHSTIAYRIKNNLYPAFEGDYRK